MHKVISKTPATIRYIVLGAYLIGSLFCVSGIIFVALGAIGSTEFTFFGQSFKSTNVGIAALFLGSTMVVLLIMRTLRTLNIAIKLDAGSKSNIPKGHWPRTKSLDSLKTVLKSLSNTQWQIFLTISENDGISEQTLYELVGIYSSVIDHRLVALEMQKLILLSSQRVFLDPKVKELLKNMRLEDCRFTKEISANSEFVD